MAVRRRSPLTPDRRLTSATQVFSEAEPAQLRAFPDTISSQELIRYFTLAPTDVGFVEHRRGAANRLGRRCNCAHCPGPGTCPPT
ncbi:DUF4158 domain-containing protein [Nocardiopsis tropica]|uniref:DUF4158 domain-containing protein n=1 Tax=Nocardiopsis tropica TaxID=109330 RepID=A0ABV1ZNJ1_9ACTN